MYVFITVLRTRAKTARFSAFLKLRLLEAVQSHSA
jgi:hypothetical protein